MNSQPPGLSADDIGHKGDEIYEEMKVLHEIRKVMTEAGVKEGNTIAAELKRLSDNIAGYPAAIQRLTTKGALTEKQQGSLDFMQAPATAERKRRIDEAAKFCDLDQLCLSGQCGFASTEEGNSLTEDEQWAKLKLIVEVADEVWGR